jgi:hypothetical protein
MSVVVFAGPTLTAAEIAAELDAVVLPPAAQGDVLRALRDRPRAIGLIDGYFDSVPSVWHKEVLWALKEGVWVFGAASMGALRAAELAPFGMVGVGEVFRRFHAKELEDDDEVAVAHGPASTGYRALSEAMVNIRATLEAAVAASILTAPTANQLTTLAKALHYPERTFSQLFTLGARAGAPPAELATFESWLATGAVNQKRKDAVDMLRAMRSFLLSDPPQFEAGFAFEHTEAWEAARIADAERSTNPTEVSSRDLLEEVQTAGLYERVAAASLARALSLRLATRLGASAAKGAIVEAANEFRRERGLLTAEAFATWLANMDVADDDVDRFFRDHANVRRVRAVLGPAMLAQLADTLREQELYPHIHRRVLEKRRVLERMHVASPSLSDLGVPEDELWRRYFRDVLGRDAPDDLPTYARLNGFDSLESLRRAALRELYFRRYTRQT